MTELFPSNIHSAAGISDCGRYRYWLSRQWSMQGDHICWIMLNPSTADANQDDPTIRKCIAFSKRWGFGGLTVVNLFALRATDPNELLKHADEAYATNRNDVTISQSSKGRRTVAAWGCHRAVGNRDIMVTRMLRDQEDASLECLGTTKDGYPRHPLYLPANVLPTRYEGRPL